MENLDVNNDKATKKFWKEIILFLVITGVVFFLCSMLIPTYPPKHLIYIPPTKINAIPSEIPNNDGYSSNENTSSPDANDLSTNFKKAISLINQALAMAQALDNNNASTCPNCNSNKQALADYFMRRLSVVDSSNPSYKKLSTALAGDGWLNNPYFLTKDEFLFIIEKAQGRCGGINTNDPDKANCVMIVDVNGSSPPNQFSTGNKSNNNYVINDRFRLIVHADRITPAANNENDAAENVLYSN